MLDPMLAPRSDNFITFQNNLLKDFILDDLNAQYQETPEIFFRNGNNNVPNVALMDHEQCRELIRQMWAENANMTTKIARAFIVYLIVPVALVIFSSLAVSLSFVGIGIAIGIFVSVFHMRVLAKAKAAVFVEQIKLRIQSIWNEGIKEGINDKNWPPLPFFHDPTIYAYGPTERWQNYKNRHLEKEAQDALFEIVRGEPPEKLIRFSSNSGLE